MLSYKESLKILKETSALLEGHFILSSGLHSGQYIQCAKLLSVPKAAQSICSSLVKKINNKLSKIDIVLAPALGGIVVGYEVGRQLNVNTIFAEREKDKLILRRGFNIPKKSNVLIIEDVITTGKSAMECSELVKKNMANLIGYACIIDRSNDKISLDKVIISQVKLHIQTYREEDLPRDIKNIKAEKPGSKNLSK